MRSHIGECGSTLYVGLAHAVPPTNTKFQPLLLPTQAGMPYTNTDKHRTSYFKSTLTIMGPAKRWKCLFAARQKRQILNIIIIIIINFKIFSLYQLIRDSTIRAQMLTIGSYSPELSAFGTLITSTKVFSLIIYKTL